MPKRNNLFVANKYNYVRGGRPNVTCILCGVLEGDPKVESLLVHEGKTMCVCLNLYPYSPGHAMIFPRRHIKDPRALTEEESQEIKSLMDLSMDLLEQELNAQSFNLGLNVGPAGGASIAHLHWHIVPRYRNETGFIDIIGGTKIIIADPKKLQVQLRKAFKKAAVPVGPPAAQKSRKRPSPQSD